MYIEEISSPQNSRLKEVVALLEKSRERRASSLFVVEGIREVTACLRNGYSVEWLLFSPAIAGEQMENLPHLQESLERGALAPKIFSLSEAAYAKIAYREGTEGIMAVVRQKEHRTLLLDRMQQQLPKGKGALILVCESIEKPGNMGAMLRTTDATGADAVIIADPRCDLYNPNLIRASLGSLFTQRVVVASAKEAGEWLRQHNFQILTAQLQDSSYYYNIDMRGPTAIVMGSEAKGLTQYWRDISTAKIKIPMLGEMDSLNVSVSAAVLCYEAVRQRMSQ